MHHAVADRPHRLHAEEEVVGERPRLGARDASDRQVREREEEVEEQEEAA